MSVQHYILFAAYEGTAQAADATLRTIHVQGTVPFNILLTLLASCPGWKCALAFARLSPQIERDHRRAGARRLPVQ
jgi:hypothetical protein